MAQQHRRGYEGRHQEGGAAAAAGTRGRGMPPLRREAGGFLELLGVQIQQVGLGGDIANHLPLKIVVVLFHDPKMQLQLNEIQSSVIRVHMFSSSE